MQPTNNVNHEPKTHLTDNQKSPRRLLSLEEIAASELARFQLMHSQAESLKEIAKSMIEKSTQSFSESNATIDSLSAQMTAIIGSNAGGNNNSMRG